MSTGRHPRPAYRIQIGGRDITRTVEPRLVSLTLAEERGGEADQLDLVLDDSDGKLQIPSKGAELTLSIGWADQLVDKGLFTVDETEHSGAPDVLTIRARSADMRASLRTRGDKSWHATTLGAIVTTIARKHELEPRIDARLSSVKVAHIDQTGESDIAFLTRLAKLHDAVCTVKKGRLLWLPITGTRTSSGAALPTLQLTRASGDAHRWHTADRDAYSGVRAYWHDPKRARQRSVLVGKSGNAKRLKESHANEADARAAAEAEWKRIQRGASTFSLTLALGVPDLAPQTPVRVSGFKPEVDATAWQAVKVSHSIADGGFTTQVELESRGTSSDAAGEAEDVAE